VLDVVVDVVLVVVGVVGLLELHATDKEPIKTAAPIPTIAE
jgi:hypothetical protein